MYSYTGYHVPNHYGDASSYRERSRQKRESENTQMLISGKDSKPLDDFFMIDPLKRSRIEEQIKKEQKMKMIAIEIEAEKPSRKERIEKEVRNKISEKEGYLQKFQMKLKKAQEEAQKSEKKLEEQLIEEEKAREGVKESVRHQCQKNLEQFEQKIEEKRKQLEQAIAHERKIIEKLNEEAIQVAEKKMGKEANGVESRKAHLIDKTNKQKEYYNSLILKMIEEVAEARKDAENEAIQKKVKIQEETELKKKTNQLLRNPVNKIRGQRQQIAESITFSKSEPYYDMYAKSKINAERVLREQEQINGRFNSHCYQPMNKQYYSESQNNQSWRNVGKYY